MEKEPKTRTTEQLGEDLLYTVKQMSPEEKAKFRERLDKSLQKWLPKYQKPQK